MVDLHTVEELAKLLKNRGETPSVEFVQFSKAYIAELKKDNRKGSAANLQTVVNSLCDYFGSSVIPIENINSLMLPKYEAFLRGERKITRLNQFKKEVIVMHKGLSDSGLHNHMRDLRVLFNAARDKYNDEDRGVIAISHYTFRFSKNDVAFALNHNDQNRKTTDIYIIPDWKILDEVQAAVVKLIS